jgi:putative colanic acid biosynthesis glycosyltransferase WcaI
LAARVNDGSPAKGSLQSAPVASDQHVARPNAVAFRILIVGVNYWPETTGIAPYTTGFARHLATKGHRVTVLTGVPHYPSWTVPPAFDARRFAVRTEEGVRVVRSPLYMPSRPTAARRAAFEASFLVHLARLGRIPRPDAIVGVIPSLSGGVLARLLGQYFSRPYGVVFQDLMGRAVVQSGIEGGHAWVAHATRDIEGWVARRAGLVGAVSPSFTPYLVGLGVDRVRIRDLANWVHVSPRTHAASEREAGRRAHGWRDDQFVVLHAGNMGSKQALEQIIDAARASTDPTLRFVLMGDGNQRSRLEAMANDLASVSFLPIQPDDRFMSTLGCADALLISERPSVSDMSLPSKLTSYLVAGRPIVAAVVPGGATHQAVQASGAGTCVEAGDPAALLTTLAALRADPDRQATLGAAGPAYAQGHLREDAAMARLDTFVTDLARAIPGSAA